MRATAQQITSILAAALTVVGCASEAMYIERGQMLASQRKYEPAIEQYMSALAENADSSQAHLGLGMVYLAMDRLPEATKAIEQARAIEETDEAIVAHAMVFYQLKEFARAASLMEEALQRSPNQAEHHLRLGIIRRQAGDLERAADSFQMAITQNPGLVEARTQLGLCLKQMQRYDEALDVLKDAVRDLRESDAYVAEVQTALGEVYEAMRLTDYAEHSFKLAVKNDAKNGGAIAGLGRVLRSKGDIEAAIELLAAASRSVPKDPRIHLELGFCYREFRLEPKAVESLTKAIELDKRQIEAYGPLLEMLDKQKASASQLYTVLAKAAQVMPDDLDMQMRFGMASYQRKMYRPAAETFKRIVTELEPASIEANYYLGLSQVGAGELEQAAQTANALQYLDPAKATQLRQVLHSGGPAAPDSASPVKKKKKKKKRKRNKKRRRR